jgi:hypothetical protein
MAFVDSVRAKSRNLPGDAKIIPAIIFGKRYNNKFSL